MGDIDNASRGGAAARSAGALLVIVGGLNALFGALGLGTAVVQLEAGAAGGLLVAGLATAAAGILVWRGSWIATLVALTVFGLLLVVQLLDAMAGGATDVEGVAGNPVIRFGALVVIVIALAAAATRSRDPRGGRRTPTGR